MVNLNVAMKFDQYEALMPVAEYYFEKFAKYMQEISETSNMKRVFAFLHMLVLSTFVLLYIFVLTVLQKSNLFTQMPIILTIVQLLLFSGLMLHEAIRTLKYFYRIE